MIEAQGAPTGPRRSGRSRTPDALSREKQPDLVWVKRGSQAQRPLRVRQGLWEPTLGPFHWCFRNVPCECHPGAWTAACGTDQSLSADSCLCLSPFSSPCMTVEVQCSAEQNPDTVPPFLVCWFWELPSFQPSSAALAFGNSGVLPFKDCTAPTLGSHLLGMFRPKPGVRAIASCPSAYGCPQPRTDRWASVPRVFEPPSGLLSA